MMILNDIWLIHYLKPFNGLFKDNEILISNLFLGGYSMRYAEKQFIRELSENGKIGLFETDLGFCKIVAENKGIIGNSDAASIYYAKQNNYPIITGQELIVRICENEKIKTYKPLEALKILNIGDDKIEFIKRILNDEKIRI